MVLDLLHNITLLVALVAAGQMVIAKFRENLLSRQLVLGLLFGGAAVFGMTTPLYFAPGVIFDGRSIVLSVAGVVGGGVAAMISAGIAGSYRYWLGGAGDVVGVTIAIQSALIGVIARHLWQRNPRAPGLAHFFALGLIVQLAMFASFTQVPGGVGYKFIAEAGYYVLIFYPLATMLLCQIFSEYQRQLINQHALRLKENMLDLATDSGRVGVWDFDPQNHRLVWNTLMYEIYGLDPHSSKDLFEAWQSAFHPDDVALINKQINDSLASGKQFEADFRIVRQSGEIRFLIGRGKAVMDDMGRPARMVGVSIDITERKQAEETIKELNRNLEQRVTDRTAQLEAANKELEAFSYSVSHDLRGPLRAIDGFSRILLDDYADKLDEEGKRLLNVVRDNTGRMAQLIDDILKFSRTGRLELSFSEIDMQTLAREVFEELQPSVDRSKLQLEIEAIPPATGDRAMMRQVFVNLLSNAIKFSRAKEPAMIRVGCSIAGDEAVYYIKDNGAGFDMQYADKLFGVFQRLHSMNEFEGTGIGLAIVKRIITRHGGRVWAEGKVNEGATIYFALPTKKSDAGN